MRGHIRKRGSTYSIVVDIGRDENGKRQQKWYSGYRTKKEAEKALDLLLAEIEKGEYVKPTNMTIGEFLDEWLEEYCKPKLAPKTYKSYSDTIRLYFKPILGRIELAKLKPITIQRYYNMLKEEGKLSDTTINYHHRLLSKALKQAVKWQYISKNPCDAVDTPKKRNVEMKIWNIENVKKAEQVFANSPIFIHVMLAIYTGMREGELCGLRWEDINFKDGTCTIRRTAQRVDKELIFKEPKTDTSTRVVALPQNIIEMLKQEKKKQAENKILLGSAYDNNYEGYISVWEDGHFKEPDYVSKKFHKMLAATPELPMIRFHDLRHTHASLMLASGANMKVVSERLGHSQIGITMDLYSHVPIELQKDAIKKLETLLQ
ncbi:site-specific integrase [Mahella australiensis]|uniref:Integrase family protein n=1 Tax=Mahella australiensis (strain DSM 15567 / CIP 107919 / 50-1 BON) TaxID=697281 RepID=F3ZZD3_MAHA5|nr:site-specific integrase [Mahella australiensis]AEE95743.1 integrase family protein [Mahella australiensis 50-1 BON]